MIIVSVIGSSSRPGQVSLPLRLSPFLGRTTGKIDTVKHPFKQILGLRTKETFCRSGTILALQEVVVDRGQSRQLPAADPVQSMVVKG